MLVLTDRELNFLIKFGYYHNESKAMDATHMTQYDVAKLYRKLGNEYDDRLRNAHEIRVYNKELEKAQKYEDVKKINDVIVNRSYSSKKKKSR